MENTEANRDAAVKAYNYLTAHPEKHSQAAWLEADVAPDMQDDEGLWVYSPEVVNLCGSTMCVAGLVQFQARGYIRPATAALDARDLLGLNTEESHFLFYDTNDEESLDALNAILDGDLWAFNDVQDRTYGRGKYDPMFTDGHDDY